jgi:hypothetical protein
VDINGLWTASFAALGEGTGVVTVRDGVLSGGDANYYYIGSYQQDGAKVTGKLRVVHYAGPLTNVFGPVREVELTFMGVAGDDLIMAQGTARSVSHPLPRTQLAISLRRVAGLGDL